jgi:hypothetical protein
MTENKSTTKKAAAAPRATKPASAPKESGPRVGSLVVFLEDDKPTHGRIVSRKGGTLTIERVELVQVHVDNVREV